MLGAAWRTFVMGERGSPGGPRALANLVMILAEDLQQNGVSVDGEGRVLPPALEADNSAPPPAAKKKRRPREMRSSHARRRLLRLRRALQLHQRRRWQHRLEHSAFRRISSARATLRICRSFATYMALARRHFFLGIFVTLGVAVTYFTVGIPVTLGVTCAVPSH